MIFLGEFDRPSLSSLPKIWIPPSTLRWLALFIEALGLSPNNEREGRQQLAISKGTSSTSYPDQKWSAAKSTGDDAILSSTVTSILPLCWSWSRCTNMETFA